VSAQTGIFALGTPEHCNLELAEVDVLRRNVAHGGVTDHGTAFGGFTRDQWRLAEMLRRMAGVGDGVRWVLTRYLTPVTGAYSTVPAVEALARSASAEG
jgi:porphyrinogen peroxidase